MLAVTMSVSAHAQALQLLQVSSLGELAALAEQAHGGKTPFASLALAGNTKADAAISAIMNILLDAQGNSQVGIFAKEGVAAVRTGDGNDTTTLDVHRALGVSSGKGNDSITIRTYALSDGGETYYSPIPQHVAVHDVASGEGDDTIAIHSHGHVDGIFAGNGDDKITINSTAEHSTNHRTRVDTVGAIDAGAGDDKIAIAAKGMVDVVEAGSGNDTIEMSGLIVSRTFGGEGNDTLKIAAERTVAGVWGGDGQDVIEVTAATIQQISGGKGNDTIVLNNTANSFSGVGFDVGDGHDVVHTNSALVIERYAGPNKSFDMSKATIERLGEATLRIAFDDADDSITVHLTGDMAGKPLAFDYYRGGSVMIRRDDGDAPALPAYGHSENPVVLTRRE